MSRAALLVLSVLPCAAWARLDADAFLASALKAPAVELREQFRGEVDSGFLNPVDSVQLTGEVASMRPKNGADSTEEHAVGLKVSPRGFTEYRKESELRAHSARIDEIELKKEINRALEERYLALIDHAHLSTRAQVMRDVLKLSEREISVLTAGNRAAQASARDLMKARESHRDLANQVSQGEASVQSSRNRLKTLDPSLKDDVLALADLRTPAEAARDFPAVSEQASPETVLAREKARAADLEWSYNIQRDERLVDSIELTHVDKEKEHVYKLEVTFNIPGLASQDYGAQKDRRDVRDARIEAMDVERADAQALSSFRSAFEKAAENYRLYAEGGVSGKINERLKRLARREDPSLLLSVERGELNERLRVADAAAEALKAYVQYLSVSGALAENPKKNYLSPGTKVGMR